MRFDAARALADAVLMEGYALYPYRASAPKNRYRWTFGVLAPRAWSEAGGCEPWWLEAQLLVAGEPKRIAGQLRCFQIERRQPIAASATRSERELTSGSANPSTGERRFRDGEPAWDEGIVQTVPFEVASHAEVPIALPAARSEDASTRRERHAIAGRIAVRREQVIARRELTKLTIRVENTTPWPDPRAPRERAIAASIASVHLLVGVDGGELLSAIDPPAWASEAVACKSTRTYPVLAGPPGTHDLMLCAPFILYDHPQIAPESAGDLCDATEIDELLALRTRMLTDDEKRAARATDPRAAEIIDRADALSDEWLARMHGAARELHAGEMIPRGAAPAVGAKVRLKTPTRPTDAQDLLYAGRVATVRDVRHDVDGTVFLAVTIDDDPAAELHGWYGRYHYYRRDEVEPL